MENDTNHLTVIKKIGKDKQIKPLTELTPVVRNLPALQNGNRLKEQKMFHDSSWRPI